MTSTSKNVGTFFLSSGASEERAKLAIENPSQSCPAHLAGRERDEIDRAASAVE